LFLLAILLFLQLFAILQFLQSCNLEVSHSSLGEIAKFGEMEIVFVES